MIQCDVIKTFQDQFSFIDGSGTLVGKDVRSLSRFNFFQFHAFVAKNGQNHKFPSLSLGLAPHFHLGIPEMCSFSGKF